MCALIHERTCSTTNVRDKIGSYADAVSLKPDRQAISTLEEIATQTIRS
jgi:hypothetical protein